jgi:hypothetical protein
VLNARKNPAVTGKVKAVIGFKYFEGHVAGIGVDEHRTEYGSFNIERLGRKAYGACLIFLTHFIKSLSSVRN